MYKETFLLWKTPFLEEKGLVMTSLIDKGGKLTITLESNTKEYVVTFNNHPAYRNILEEYRLKLWNLLSKKKLKGSSLILENSKWISELKDKEPLFEEFNKNARHYLISTGDDVIEILSDAEPIIKSKRL